MPQIRTCFKELFWGKLDITLILPNGGPEVAWEHSACEEGRTLLRGQLTRLKQRAESQYHRQSELETDHGKTVWPKSKVVCSDKWQLNNYWPNHIEVSVWLLGYLRHYGNKQELRKPHVSVVTPSTETKASALLESPREVSWETAAAPGKTQQFCTQQSHTVATHRLLTTLRTYHRPYSRDSSAHQHFISYHNYTNFLYLLGKLHKTQNRT